MLDTRIIELKPYSGAARDNFYFALDSQDLGTKRVSFKWLCDHLGGSGGDVSGKADKVGQGHRGKLASFTSDGNLADSGLPVDNVATKDDLHNYQPHRTVLDRTQEFTADEKAKLGGIEANANHYVHPQFTSRDKGLYKVKVDGKCGKQTIKYIKKFQKAMGMKATGRFGKKTLAKAKAVKK